jgi:hypothetical protein
LAMRRVAEYRSYCLIERALELTNGDHRYTDLRTNLPGVPPYDPVLAGEIDELYEIVVDGETFQLD